MVDFDTNALVFREAGIKVVAASVDDLDQTTSLKDGMRIGYVQMYAGLDAHAVSEATGAFLQTGDRLFTHATGFVTSPEGTVMNAVYSTGPIGRLTASDVFKKVEFEKFNRAKRS